MRSKRELLAPAKVGPLELPNRIVMSPMSRIRADKGYCPNRKATRRQHRQRG
jgi:2,4-dienoyl-CoA reductase-like NADH-dependent reductase (Old Yellow Enzyme family)